MIPVPFYGDKHTLWVLLRSALLFCTVLSSFQSASSAWAYYNRIKDAWDYPHVQQCGMKKDHVEHFDLVLRVIGQPLTFAEGSCI